MRLFFVREMSTQCYCCRPTRKPDKMDLDSALNELGMLSSVTEGRLQYMREKNRMRRRGGGAGRTWSTSQIEEIGESSTSSLSQDPNKNPSNDSFEIVRINPQFVTSLCAGPDIDAHSKTEDLSIGNKYAQSNLEMEAQLNRRKHLPRLSHLSRAKLPRIRRFKKPYEVPWRHALEERGAVMNIDTAGAEHGQLGCTPKKAKIPPKIILSKSSTPEKAKPPKETTCTVHRSRSLDNLDFSQLQIAEAENHNIIIQRREIDKMSQNLCSLQLDTHNIS